MGRLIDAMDLKQAIALSSILEDGKTLEQIIDEVPTASDWDRYSTKLWREAYESGKRDGNSTVQPSGWLETHVEETMQAGYEGREVEFRLNGRAFRIREVPQ